MGFEDKAIGAFVGVLVLWIVSILLQAITPSLFATWTNTQIFPYGNTATLLIQLITLLLAVVLVIGVFRRDDEQTIIRTQ